MANKRFNQITRVVTSFDSNDVLPVGNNTLGDGKMTGDQLLELTAQNALEQLAPPFDESGNTTYQANDPVIRNGHIYFFKYKHSGTWAPSTVYDGGAIAKLQRIASNQIFGNWAYNPSDLNDLKENVCWVVSPTSATTTLHFPSDYPEATGLLYVYKANYSTSHYQVFQILYQLSAGVRWYRSYNSNGSTWSAWTKVDFTYGYVPYSDVKIYADLNTNPADLNDLKETKLYDVWRTSSTQTLNFPSALSTGWKGFLVCVKTYSSKPNNQYQVLQKLIETSTNVVWYRQYNSIGNSWGTWIKLDVRAGLVPYSDVKIISNLSTNPADLNDLKDTNIYEVYRYSNTQTLNFPSNMSAGWEGILICLKTYSSKPNNQYQVLQKLISTRTNNVWWRIYNSIGNSWGSWSAPTNVVEIGDGKQFETLRAGMTYAYNYIQNAKVIVYPGTYDLVDECSDILATTLTENFTPCPLGHGMHVIFRDGAKVTCMIEKTEDMTDERWNSIKRRFEPFAYVGGDFILENADISAKNCRYCVHDDIGAYGTYTHKYINCKMYRTNSNLGSQNNFVSCIGGGLGQHGTIVVEGGYYKSEPVVGSNNIMNGALEYQQIPISWHNTTTTQSECSITLKDVYFADKGYFMTSNLGPSTTPSKCYISGCRFGLPPIVGIGPGIINFELAAEWNNDIAQAGTWSYDSETSQYEFTPSN